METQLRPELAKNTALKALVDAATPVLDEVLGRASDRVTAAWNVKSDEQGRELLELTLSDWSGSQTRKFAPDELQPPERADWKFHRLWGDLLQAATRRKISELEEALANDESA